MINKKNGPTISLGCSETFMSHIRVWRDALDAMGKPSEYSADSDACEFEDWISTNCNEQSNRTKLIYRCRYWIRREISQFRWDNFENGMKCPITGEGLEYGTCHVDHVFPNTFVGIFELFLDEFDINVDGLDFVDWKSVQDAGILHDWVDFHREFACLAVISPKANTSVIPKYINRHGAGKVVEPGLIDVSSFYSSVRRFYLGS